MAQIGPGRIAICVFAKPPRAGEAKTRLSAVLGDAGAARLAEALFRDAWSKVTAIDWARAVLATTDEHAEAWSAVPAADVWPQGDGDLGQRMERVLRRALETTDAAIAIGTDCPTLPASRLHLARVLLETHEAVIGPSEDGGFYLLGVRRCPEGLLDGVAWGTAAAHDQTLERIRRAGMTAASLPSAFDVDRPEDVDRLRRALPELRDFAPETAKVLAAVSVPEPPGATARPRLSVIVPTLNEERVIGAQLARLAVMPGVDEVIVADGSSIDRTAEIVRSSGTARLVVAPSGRGSQMNAGARAATGAVLLFLHADVVLPHDAAALIEDALADSRTVGGAFGIRTVPDGGSGWPRRLLWLADLRSRYSRLPYGDQALFVRRDAFESIGGFADVPLFEDVEISRRLRRAGRLRRLRASVQVSGRRFMARPIYYALAMNVLPLLYRLGVPPAALARMYGHVR
jgi:rSAM/selenodomain-associated transferase 2/rSAM/selenodomain-associated transferase 1